jgi:hypothetical protein
MSSRSFLDEGYRELLRRLGISEAWIASGIITTPELPGILREFEERDGPFVEHVRWRKFIAFIDSKSPMKAETAHQLYATGDSDPESALGGSR